MRLQTEIQAGVETDSAWQQSLRLALRTPSQILEYVGIKSEPLLSLAEGSAFPAFATREYLNRIEKADPLDPLLLQVLPQVAEQTVNAGWTQDPVGDHAAEILPGLLHKYEGRMLLIATGACAVHCRYCFRQHFPYSNVPKSIEDWKPAIDRIGQDSSVHEIILSGGDPLMLVDDKLTWLSEQFDAIPHLQRLRIHTRLPVMIPKRVNSSLLQWLGSTRLSTWMVLHINHSNEIDSHVADAIDRLKRVRCQLLNQSVLLKNINDSVEALVSLSERLLEVGVVPYYLHQMDPVQGAAHFEVRLETGKRLIEELRRKLPGYGVPRYVSEIAGEAHKSLLM